MANHHPVYIIDDDASIRSSLRFLLSHAGFRSTAFESGEAFLAAAPQLEPGCVLLDVRLNGIDGLTVQQELRQRGLRMPVVIITGHGEVPLAVTAMKYGAIDFLSKPLSRDDVLAVVGLASDRLDDETAMLCHAEAAAVKLNVLTPREMQVMQFLSLGLPNKTIAYDLGISSRTVEVHRSNIMHKLGVKSFPEALRIAYAAGLPDHVPARVGNTGVARSTPPRVHQEL
jgi:two-component system, LuxR family, response regulator FixJ